jgi:hypothetical protein
MACQSHDSMGGTVKSSTKLVGWLLTVAKYWRKEWCFYPGGAGAPSSVW